MINILINLSGKSYDIYNEHIKINPQDVDKKFHVYSPYEITKNENVKLIKTPMNNCLATLMNNIFWIINMYFHENKNEVEVEKFWIYHNQETLNNWKIDEINKDELNIKLRNDWLSFNDKKLLEIPTSSFYKKNTLFKQDLFLEVWFYLLQEILDLDFDNKIKDEFNKIDKNDEKETKIKKIIENKKKNNLYINEGNEGILFYKDSTKEEIVKKINNIRVLEENPTNNIGKLYKFHEVQYYQEGVKDFYDKKTLLIEYKKNTDSIEYKYKNIILPTSSINFPQAARLAINQREKNIFIDDNKLINYGKIRKIILNIENIDENIEIFELIYNDFGCAFIKTESNEFQRELLRDIYYLVKNYGRVDCREIIRSKRYIPLDKLIAKKPRLKSFIDFVEKGYEECLPMPCHDLEARKNLKNYDSVATCNGRSTMRRIMKKSKDQLFCYDQKLNEVFKCNHNYIPPGFKEEAIKIKELSKNLELIEGAKKWIRE